MSDPYSSGPAENHEPPDPTLRPIPRPTRISRPFWDACAQGRLLYQRDAVTGAPIFPPQEFSVSSVTIPPVWAESKGEGSVYSYSVVSRPQTPAFEVPYVVAIVELDEGYTMMSNIIDCKPDEVSIGMRVHVAFRPIRDGIVLPFFAPAAQDN